MAQAARIRPDRPKFDPRVTQAEADAATLHPACDRLGLFAALIDGDHDLGEAEHRALAGYLTDIHDEIYQVAKHQKEAVTSGDAR